MNLHGAEEFACPRNCDCEDHYGETFEVCANCGRALSDDEREATRAHGESRCTRPGCAELREVA